MAERPASTDRPFADIAVPVSTVPTTVLAAGGARSDVDGTADAVSPPPDDPPQAAAFHVLKNVYLSMHPGNLAALIGGRVARYRLYSGFAAWAPGQLEAEFGRDAWHVLPAEEALLFREDTSGLWEALLAKAAGPKT